jgi:hypothetical protein
MVRDAAEYTAVCECAPQNLARARLPRQRRVAQVPGSALRHRSSGALEHHFGEAQLGNAEHRDGCPQGEQLARVLGLELAGRRDGQRQRRAEVRVRVVLSLVVVQARQEAHVDGEPEQLA